MFSAQLVVVAEMIKKTVLIISEFLDGLLFTKKEINLYEERYKIFEDSVNQSVLRAALPAIRFYAYSRIAKAD